MTSDFDISFLILDKSSGSFKLAAKLFQIYEYCRQQLIKCFKEQIIDGAKKAVNALDFIFEPKKVVSNV